MAFPGLAWVKIDPQISIVIRYTSSKRPLVGGVQWERDFGYWASAGTLPFVLWGVGWVAFGWTAGWDSISRCSVP